MREADGPDDRTPKPGPLERSIRALVGVHEVARSLHTVHDLDDLSILNLVGFIGLAGLHRFYLGHIGLGLLMLFTSGGFGFWTLIDLCRIRAIVEEVNRQKEQEVSAQVKVLAPGRPSSRDPGGTGVPVSASPTGAGVSGSVATVRETRPKTAREQLQALRRKEQERNSQLGEGIL